MPPAARKPRAKVSAAATAAEVADDARASTLKAFITKAGRKETGAVFTFVGAALDVPVVPTGALSLDFALGVGGIPRGRITELYGPESVGKTSLALSVCAQAIKAGGMAAIIDAEHAIDPGHAKSMGVDPDYLAISQPSSGENALQMLQDMIEANLFDVIVVDSVAMLVPQAELDGEMTDMQVGAQARMLSKGLRKLTGPIAASKAAVIFINQLRAVIGGYGNPEQTPGGKALKYAASVRLDIRAAAGKQIKDPNDAKVNIGLGTTVKVVKNKVAPPQGVANYNLIWGKGIDFAASVFFVAKDLGVIVESPGHSWAMAATGETFTDEEDKPLRGAARIQELFSADDALAAQVAALCYASIADRREAAPLDDSVFDSDFKDPDEMDDDEALAGVGNE